jgi:uncharacterized protein (DUF427 family)
MTNTTNDTSRTERSGVRRLLSKLAPGQEESRPMQAVWKGTVIAESDDTVVVEGNHYFPLDAVNPDVLRPSSHHTVCPWKGVASYYDVAVGGEVNRDAAWYYPKPSPLARKVANRVAFWKGVKVRPVQ